MPAPASTRHDPWAVVRIPSFRWFLTSLNTMAIAAQVQAVVLGWEVYQLTGDPLSLGLLGLSEAAPFLAVALYAGHVVDRRDRRLVSVAALVVLLAAGGVLLAMVLASPEPTRVWPYYAVLGVCGIARSFLQTARSALIAEIVPRELLSAAATWRSSMWQAGLVIGPALGGAMLASFGARWALGLNLMAGAVALLAMIRLRHVPTVISADSVSVIRNLIEGFRYVTRERVILGAISLDLLAVFFGGAVAMLPIYASDILQAGEKGFGVLLAAPGVGAVSMAMVLAHRRPFRRAGPALLGSVTVFGVAMIAFAVSKSFLFSVVMLVISGAADNVSAVIRATLIQVRVPPTMLGRVSSVNAIFIGSSNELGAFESGLAARLLGVVPSVVFGGVMTLLTVGVVGWRVKDVRLLGAIDASPPGATVA